MFVYSIPILMMFVFFDLGHTYVQRCKQRKDISLDNCHQYLYKIHKAYKKTRCWNNHPHLKHKYEQQQTQYNNVSTHNSRK